MKEKLTEYTINSLLALGIIYSFGITQSLWGWDLIPKHFESFFYGIFIAIGVLVFFMFLASFIYELQAIRKILNSRNKD